MKSEIIDRHRQRHGTWITERHVLTDTKVILQANSNAMVEQPAERKRAATEEAREQQRWQNRLWEILPSIITCIIVLVVGRLL